MRPDAASRLPRVALWLVLASALLIVVAACESGSPADSDETVTGVIVDVQGSLTRVDTFDLLLPDGTRMTFVPEPGVLEAEGFSPSHLREHMALVDAITVSYHDVDGKHVMSGIGDASS